MKRKLFLLLVIFLNIGFIHAQNIDSLKTQVWSKNKEHSADAAINLGNYYLLLNLDSAQKYANTALTLIEKDNLLKFKYSVNNLQGNIYENYGLVDSAMVFYKKALESALNEKSKKRLAGISNNIGRIYKKKLLYDSSDIYYQKALELNKEIKDSINLGIVLNNIGNLNSELANYSVALVYLTQAGDIFEYIKNYSYASYVRNNIGNIYFYIGDFEHAADNYYKVLNYSVEINDLVLEAGAYNNLAITHKFLKNYERSIDYLRQALSIYEKINDVDNKHKALHNFGVTFLEAGQYDSAYVYYMKSLKITKELNNLKGMAETIGDIGEIFFQRNMNDSAEFYFQKSIDINKKVNNLYNECLIKTRLGILYLNQNKLLLSEKYLNDALQIALQIEATDYSKEIYHNLSKVYQNKGEYKKALLLYKDYKTYEDSLNKSDAILKIEELETRFEVDKKNNQIELLKKNELINQLELKRRTLIFYISLLIIVFMVISFALVIASNRRKKKMNKMLLQQNVEIKEQRDEIEAQRDEIEAQRDMVYSQKLDLEAVHSKISQSIDYAKLIQSSILPDPLVLKERIADYFVLYKPKDVVSGDFYWWAKVENNIIIAAVDCTGHGVPGAFMSMLGISFLREIVMKEYVTHPGVILRKLRKEVIRSLKQNNELGSTRDGMDMALVNIDLETKKIQYAGANNPLYIVSKNAIKANDKVIPYQLNGLEEKLYEVKADKMPISIYHKLEPFTNHEIQLQKGDKLYLFSDGFIDQFGGADGKRFMYSNFRNLLLANSQKDFQQQSNVLDETFETWKGEKEQIDDVLIIGIEL